MATTALPDAPPPPAPVVGAFTPPAPPPAARCAECEAALAGPYCHACGQRAAGADDLTLGRFARAGLHEVAGTDARLVRSLWTLARRPGLLTREFLDGHRRRWSSPVQLFLLASAAYFVYAFGAMTDATGSRAIMATQLAEGMRRVDPAAAARAAANPALRPDGLYDAWAAVLAWGKFANVALLALAVWALHRRRVRGGLPAVTFTLHYYAFDFLLFTAAAPLFQAAAWLRGAPLPQAAMFALVPLEAVYVYVALRRTFGDGRGRAAGSTAALLAADFVVSTATGMVALGWVVGSVLARAS